MRNRTLLNRNRVSLWLWFVVELQHAHSERRFQKDRHKVLELYWGGSRCTNKHKERQRISMNRHRGQQRLDSHLGITRSIARTLWTNCRNHLSRLPAAIGSGKHTPHGPSNARFRNAFNTNDAAQCCALPAIPNWITYQWVLAVPGVHGRTPRFSQGRRVHGSHSIGDAYHHTDHQSLLDTDQLLQNAVVSEHIWTQICEGFCNKQPNSEYSGKKLHGTMNAKSAQGSGVCTQEPLSVAHKSNSQGGRYAAQLF